MTEYKAWATGAALPYLRANLDVVGFWTNVDEPAQVNGKDLDELGSASVTWIIRWADMDTRTEQMGKIFAAEAWSEIMKGNPGVEHYHRIEAKFAEEL